MSSLICGIDLETTGLDTEKDEIIEIAAVIWDIDRAIPVMMMSDMINLGKPITSEITEITGITADDLVDYGKPWHEVADMFIHMVVACNYVMAHNGLAFDKPIIERQLAKLGKDLPIRPWIDTSIDVPFPAKMQTRKLSHLACEHNFLNPFAHRALFDVLTMLKIASNYDMHQMIASARSPLVKVQALCKKPWDDAGASVDEAKQYGYRWDGAKKIWCKQVRQAALEKEEPKLFKHAIIG